MTKVECIDGAIKALENPSCNWTKVEHWHVCKKNEQPNLFTIQHDVDDMPMPSHVVHGLDAVRELLNLLVEGE